MEFKFIPHKLAIDILLCLAYVAIGWAGIRQGLQYEAQVLIDMDVYLWPLIGVILLLFGIIEFQFVVRAAVQMAKKLILSGNTIQIIDKGQLEEFKTQDIKKVEYFESIPGRRTITNGIEFIRLTTKSDKVFVLNSYKISPKKFDSQVNIPDSKKCWSDNKFWRFIR